MTPEQSRFLDLHRRYFVTRWQWLFQGGMLRAETECRRVVTITQVAFAELVDLGFCDVVGSAGVRLIG
jgi:hypothetical protein